MYPARNTSTITSSFVFVRAREVGEAMQMSNSGGRCIDMQVRRHRRAPRRLWMLVASRKRMRTINALPGSLSSPLLSASSSLVLQPAVVARYLSTCRAALWLINSCFLRIAVVLALHPCTPSSSRRCIRNVDEARLILIPNRQIPLCVKFQESVDFLLSTVSPFRLKFTCHLQLVALEWRCHARRQNLLSQNCNIFSVFRYI